MFIILTTYVAIAPAPPRGTAPLQPSTPKPKEPPPQQIGEEYDHNLKKKPKKPVPVLDLVVKKWYNRTFIKLNPSVFHSDEA